MKVDQYTESYKGVYNVKISIGHSKTIQIVINEDDDLIDIARNLCTTYKLDHNQCKEIADKLKEAIQMKAIGMAEIYEKAVSENEKSPLLKSAEKLVEQLKRRHKQTVKQEKNLDKELHRRSSISFYSEKKKKPATKITNDIYMKDMIKKAEWETKRQSLNEEARKKEMEGVTFTPTLDIVTRVMAKHMPDLETRMKERLAKARAKIEVLRKNSIEKEKSNYTFKPSINPLYYFIFTLDLFVKTI